MFRGEYGISRIPNQRLAIRGSPTTRPHARQHTVWRHPGRPECAGFRFEGREYTVFIDESFHHFFNFRHHDGKFIHGAMGIPTERYESFIRSLAPAIAKYN